MFPSSSAAALQIGNHFRRTVQSLSRLSLQNQRLVYSRSAASYGKFSVGDKTMATKTYTEEDVLTFGQISGDMNPLHIDKEYAKTTRFGQPVVHGMLTCRSVY